MRVADRPLPTSIVLDPGALADWPVRPVFAIEQTPVPPYTWDDGNVWGAAGLVWDAATVLPAWDDATCDFTGCVIEYDAPDDAGIFPAGHVVLQLDNRSGRWAVYNVDGSPTNHGAGLQLWIWCRSNTAQWWLFAGRIARWDERADDTIEIEAFDYFSDLAQPVGTFTPGAPADLPAARLAAIVTASGAGALLRTRFAAGTVHLTAQPTTVAPLEEMETVTASDGGLLYGDADGTIVSTDRLWRVGRADQTAVPVVATNVCTAPIVLWDPVLSTTDTALAGTVVLENVAHLKATASKPRPGHFVVSDSGQQWTTQTEGDTLAADLVAQLWQARLSIDTADLYLTDPAHPQLWGAVDWRRLDRIRLLHDSKTPTGTARIDIEALIWSLTDEITPDGWVRSFSTTRAVAYYPPTYWDQTVTRWDEPGAVWGY